MTTAPQPSAEAPQWGTRLTAAGAEFTLHGPDADRIWLCLFDQDRELERLPLVKEGATHTLFVPGLADGQHYGFRAEGIYDPDRGLWFDPAKLLVDPHATELDRPFVHDPLLCQYGADTTHLVPRAILRQHKPVPALPPVFKPGGLVYEVAVRPFTMLHPDVPDSIRGTVAALAHPAVISHLKRIGVSAVELMPITAWIDERHLPPLGLRNGWGYNPVALMALDPRLVPGGVGELRATVDALHPEGIGVILDLVFNHTGESDRFGATLSLRGLDNLTAFRHVQGQPGVLVNDTGCGNTLACDHPAMQALVLQTLRHFVKHAGIDGFRFDLAPILFRSIDGFDAGGPLATAMLADPVLADRILIAEPWDIGPGGYQLGRFPSRFLEWNDQARDRLRRIWRGDPGMTGDLATVLAGSSDAFGTSGPLARGVTFLAAHDGFTLMDLVSYSHKHNEANGEDNRDGHNDNHSWNNGAEGWTDRPDILEARRRDVKALLSTLFATKGTIMLTAGDEAGRSQQGNNNAYAQDNAITWIDWQNLDPSLIAHTAFLATLRNRFAVFADLTFFDGQSDDVVWWHPDGTPMRPDLWENPQETALAMILKTVDGESGKTMRLAVLFNRAPDARTFHLPEGLWSDLHTADANAASAPVAVPGRSVQFMLGNLP